MIGEEFADARIPLAGLVDIREGAINKRRAAGRDHGVALLAEGLLEKLDPETFSGVTYDSFGNVRLEELALSRLLEQAGEREPYHLTLNGMTKQRRPWAAAATAGSTEPGRCPSGGTNC